MRALILQTIISMFFKLQNLSDRIENIVENAENADNQYFLLY